MALSAGARLGPYEVVAPLGAGGMGEVYRARDARLAREVAIKVLPPAVADDPERTARFQREAQLLAALNHPNIGAIHGFEREGTLQFLVLELVEGQTLAERLSREGPLHLDDALPIARQIADALEAAHEKGIIHRDLKPGNIMLTPDGHVKVLDFGLAKALETTTPSGDLSASPTLTMAATKAGVILGTAAYMAPEQAKGRIADKRCDVWSFGCVLYEMLSGRRAFEGEDLTDTIAAVVRGEPDWSALPAGVPEHIRLLIRRCLDKDRRSRISDMGTVRFLMNEPAISSMSSVASSAGPPVAGTAVSSKPSSQLLFTTAVAGLVAGLVLAGGSAWMLMRPAPVLPAPPVRFAIASPAGQSIQLQSIHDDVAISADGTRLVYPIGNAPNTPLMIRDVAQLEPVVLEGTEGARNPFLSPDGKWVGFFVGQQLLKIPATGGAPIVVCRIGQGPRGATWSDADMIVFATNDPTVGLLQVSAAGGEPRPVSTIEPGQVDHVFPSFLPGGEAVLFSIVSSGTLEATAAALDLRTGAIKTLGAGHHPQYMDPGYIVYAVDARGSLRALRFDARRLESSGEALALPERAFTTNGAAKFAVSKSGSLVYAPGDAVPVFVPRALTWVDRSGREEQIAVPPHNYAVARLSPDGTRLALDARDGGNDIWIWDLARRTLSRLTSEPTNDLSPVWSGDSRKIIFASSRDGNPNLYMQSADGTGAIERLTNTTRTQFPTSVSPDQKHILLFELGAATDILVLPLQGERKTAPLMGTPAVESNGEISPDGRWLAYQSNDSGINEVHVRPFPNVDAGRWTISSGGGSRPAWSSKGSELFYLDGKGLLTSVPVQTGGASFVAGAARTLLETAYYPGFSLTGADLRGYDVTADGQRFLMIKEDSSASPPASSLVVVLNWRETLTR